MDQRSGGGGAWVRNTEMELEVEDEGSDAEARGSKVFE